MIARVLLLLLLSAPVAAEPLVIAHRGASGYRPEHTMAAYRLAIAQGADFIEPDLVLSRDGVLVVRHDNELARVELDAEGAVVRDAGGRPVVTSSTTNVADKRRFADRLTVKVIDGVQVGGWFVEDFTLRELRSLRARERLPEIRPKNTRFRDQRILTFRQVVRLAKRRGVGIYPETKHPTWMKHEGHHLDGSPIGVDTSQLLVDVLVEEGFTDPGRVFIQSFELANLFDLRTRILPRAGLDLPLVQLLGDTSGRHQPPVSSFSVPWDVRYHAARDELSIYGPLRAIANLSVETTYGDLVTPEALAFLSGYAAGIGPWAANVLPREPFESATPPAPTPPGPCGASLGLQHSRLVGGPAPWMAHAAFLGLEIHPYTLRQEATFRTTLDGRVLSVTEEAQLLVEAGATGFFIEQPDCAPPQPDRAPQ